LTSAHDENVVAYVDGQLDGDALLALQTQLANEPDLAERVAAHRWIARQITAAYGLPPRGDNDALIARFELGGARVVALSGHRRPVVPRGQRIAVLAGIAASLALGMIVGPAFLASNPAMVRGPGRWPTASGMLAASLSNQLAGDAGRVRIGLSFRTDHGICRTFRTDQGVAGIGCREATQWSVPIMVTTVGRTGDAKATEFHLAAGDFPPAIMAQVDRQIRGEPLSTIEEAALRERQWQ
jgi:hypothetical protein